MVTGNIADEMEERCHTHDSVSEDDGYDFSAIEPGRAVYHTNYCCQHFLASGKLWKEPLTVRDAEDVNSGNGEAFSDSVV